jgi:hypothetical protein
LSAISSTSYDSGSKYSATLAPSASSVSSYPCKYSSNEVTPITSITNLLDKSRTDADAYTSTTSTTNKTDHIVHALSKKTATIKTTDIDIVDNSRRTSKTKKYLMPPSFSIPRSVRRSLLLAAQGRAVSNDPASLAEAPILEEQRETQPQTPEDKATAKRATKRSSKLNRRKTIFTARRVRVEELAEQRRQMVYSPATTMHFGSDAGSEVLRNPGGGGATPCGPRDSPTPTPSVRTTYTTPPRHSPIPVALVPGGVDRAARLASGGGGSGRSTSGCAKDRKAGRPGGRQ